MAEQMRNEISHARQWHEIAAFVQRREAALRAELEQAQRRASDSEGSADEYANRAHAFRRERDEARAELARANPRVHELKTWPEFFHAILDGRKT